MKRTAEIVLFLAGVTAFGLPQPYQWAGPPLLVGWWLLWRPPPIRGKPPVE